MAHRVRRSDAEPGARRSAIRRDAEPVSGDGPVGPPERGLARGNPRVLRRRNHHVRRASCGGGVAIGVAWGGLLANFAAGAFLVFLRPFKVGDFVTVGGVTGTVDAIGLFGTTLNTPDNVVTIVGNNKVFSDTIQNYSANPYRRIDLTATITTRWITASPPGC